MKRTWSADDLYVRVKVPMEATDAWPGSPEKVAVLAWRYANGFILWHPDDVVLEFPSHIKTRTSYGRFDLNVLRLMKSKARTAI